MNNLSNEHLTNTNSNKEKVKQQKDQYFKDLNDNVVPTVKHFGLKGKNDGPKKSRNLPNTTSSFTKARNKQSLGVRNILSYDIKKNVDSQISLRKKFSYFYIIYMSIVTLLIFLVIIDPVALFRDKASYYPESLKNMLLGVFFLHILSIFITMISYAFSSTKSIVHSFNSIGKNKKKK